MNPGLRELSDASAADYRHDGRGPGTARMPIRSSVPHDETGWTVHRDVPLRLKN